MSHTPAPWKTHPYSTCIMTENKNGDDVYICSLALPNNSINKPQGEHYIPSQKTQEANACLIAAAPELLAALKAMLEEDDGGLAADQAREAVAKAEGK